MEIVKEFGIQPILLLAQVVNFTILLILLKKFLYKPVLKALDERKAKVAKSLKDSEEIEKRLQTISDEQATILGKARAEASKVISEAKDEAKQLTEKSLAQTKETMQQLLDKNKERLILEKEQMMLEAKKELTDLVMAATTIVAKKEVSKASASKLIEETIESLGEK